MAENDRDDSPSGKLLRWGYEIPGSVVGYHCPNKHPNDCEYDAKKSENKKVVQLIRFDEEERDEAAKVDNSAHKVGCCDVGAASS